jgi:hypothetical protein
VEYEDRTNWIARRGWGLDFSQKAGTSNWVHFAIPTHKGFDLTIILLHFTVNDATITGIHLYDGRQRFFTQEVKYGSADGQEQYEENHLGGSSVKFKIHRALGVSLKVEAASNKDGTLGFHAVGAQLEGL